MLTLGTLEGGGKFALPLNTATRRLAILAMPGAGKSNAAVVIAEEMTKQGIPWVAIDPKGDWWGIRSSKDGLKPGLPVPVFGGRHGDFELAPEDGEKIANMIIRRRQTCVLDVSLMKNQDRWRFLHDLGETLLRQDPAVLHLFLDEAQDYIPQVPRYGGNQPSCLGTWERIVKLGRAIGIGCTLITQRSASLNNDALFMVDALVAMRTAGPGDIKVIKAWVEHSGAEQTAEVVKALQKLEDGEAFISSPGWLRSTQRVHFRRRETFDSGATPVEVGRPAAVRFASAEIDFDGIRQALGEKSQPSEPSGSAEQSGQLAALEARNCKLLDDLATQAETIVGLMEENRDLLRRIERAAEALGWPEGIETEPPGLEARMDKRREDYGYKRNRAGTVAHGVRNDPALVLPAVGDGGAVVVVAGGDPAGTAQRGPEPGVQPHAVHPERQQVARGHRGDGGRAAPTQDARGQSRRTEDMNDEELDALVDAKVEVPAPVFIQHQYQQRAVDRLLATLDDVTDVEREAYRYIASRDVFVSVGDMTQVIDGVKGGASQVKWGGATKRLLERGLLVKGGSGGTGYKVNARAWIEEELKPHDPTADEVDEVYQAVLARLV